MAVILQHLQGRGMDSLALRKMSMGSIREAAEAVTTWVRTPMTWHSSSEWVALRGFKAPGSRRPGLGSRRRGLARRWAPCSSACAGGSGAAAGSAPWGASRPGAPAQASPGLRAVA